MSLTSNWHSTGRDGRVVRRAAFVARRVPMLFVRATRAARMRSRRGARAQGGDPIRDSTNLQTLCRTCHIEKTRGERTRTRSPSADAWLALVASLAAG